MGVDPSNQSNGQGGQSTGASNPGGGANFGGRGSRRRPRGRGAGGQIICYGCGKFGHIAAKCPDAAAKVATMDEEEQPEDVMNMFAAEFKSVEVKNVPPVPKYPTC